MYFICNHYTYNPGVSNGKESACNAGDLGLIPGWGRCQYSGLENSMDCIAHGVTKTQTQLSDFHMSYFRFHVCVTSCDICLSLSDPPGGSEVKASACNAGDLGLIPGSGRSPGEDFLLYVLYLTCDYIVTHATFLSLFIFLNLFAPSILISLPPKKASRYS